MSERIQQPPPLSAEEAAEVIREATRIQEKTGPASLSHEDVLAMGRELGLTPEAIEKALASRSERAAEREKGRKEQKKLLGHVSSYLSTLVLLTLIDVVTGPGWWVQWVAMGWGIGVASHVLAFLRGRILPER